MSHRNICASRTHGALPLLLPGVVFFCSPSVKLHFCFWSFPPETMLLRLRCSALIPSAAEVSVQATQSCAALRKASVSTHANWAGPVHERINPARRPGQDVTSKHVREKRTFGRKGSLGSLERVESKTPPIIEKYLLERPKSTQTEGKKI